MMADTLEERAIGERTFDTGLSFAITLESSVLSAADVLAALMLIEGITDSINSQLRIEESYQTVANLDGSFDFGPAIQIVPEVFFERGSVRIWTRLRSNYNGLSEEGKTRVATIAAAVILAVGGLAAATFTSGGELPPTPNIVITVNNNTIVDNSYGTQQNYPSYDIPPDSGLSDEIVAAIGDVKKSCSVSHAISAWNDAQQYQRKYGKAVPTTIETECDGQHYVLKVDPHDN
jgi:hypothetical protein